MWIPEALKVVAAVVGGLIAYHLGRISARDAAARKVVADDVGIFLVRWLDLSQNLASHQSGKAVDGSVDLEESRIALSQEFQAVRAFRIRIEYLLGADEGTDLFNRFQHWWSLSTGDKGIISATEFSFNRLESRAAQISSEEFSIALVQLRLKILQGKSRLRF
jgi:hypothetical protein